MSKSCVTESGRGIQWPELAGQKNRIKQNSKNPLGISRLNKRKAIYILNPKYFFLFFCIMTIRLLGRCFCDILTLNA